jgi:hypothetical protein
MDIKQAFSFSNLTDLKAWPKNIGKLGYNELHQGVLEYFCINVLVMDLKNLIY